MQGFDNAFESRNILAELVGLFDRDHPKPSRRGALLGLGIVAVAASTRAVHAAVLRQFYVSAAGNDTNDGSSPAKAWASIARVLEQPLLSGDQILFRRGEGFTGHLGIKRAAPHRQGDASILIGAYGEGPRPLIQGYKRIPASAWINHAPGIWKVPINGPEITSPTSAVGADGANIGFLRVDGHIRGDKKFTLADLTEDWQFFSDEAAWLYVRLSRTPGEAADEILATPRQNCSPTSGVTLRGLDIVGYGAHGVEGALVDVLIEDCIIREIGGSRLKNSTRYGNGIQCWAGSNRVSVRNNLIQDIYDVACTMQGNYNDIPSDGWRDILFQGNVITRCNQALEVWAQYGGAGVKSAIKPFRNASFIYNIISRIGYGWSSDVRPDQETKSPILFYNVDASSLDLRIQFNRIREFAGALIYTPKGTAALPAGVLFIDNNVHFASSSQLIQAHMGYPAADWARFVEVTGIGEGCTAVIDK